MTKEPITALVERITPAEVGALAHGLVAIPSHSDAGTTAVAGWLEEFLSAQGLPTRIQPAGGSHHVNLLVGYPELTKAPLLLLNGHLDTVPPTPNGGAPEVRGKLLFGRGAADMKGAVAAMTMALVALQRAKFPLKRPVMLAAVAGEEIGGLGTKALVREVKAEACIVGEPTQLRLVTAHKGVEWGEIVVEGRSAHASRPELGVNSIHWAAVIVQALRELGARWTRERSHPLLGSPTLNIGVIQGGMAPNVVPDRCLIRFDRRWLPGEELEAIYEEIRATLGRLVQGTNVQVQVKRMEETLHSCPMETRPDHPFIRTLQGVAAEEGLSPELLGVPYGTDGAILVGRGIPTVVWGPGDIAQAHTADEHIDLGEVWSATRAYLRAIVRLCNG